MAEAIVIVVTGVALAGRLELVGIAMGAALLMTAYNPTVIPMITHRHTR